LAKHGLSATAYANNHLRQLAIQVYLFFLFTAQQSRAIRIEEFLTLVGQDYFQVPHNVVILKSAAKVQKINDICKQNVKICRKIARKTSYFAILHYKNRLILQDWQI
jgi:hypothetical protein